MRRILARITFLYKVKFGVSAGIMWTAELYTYVLIRQLFASQVKQELSSIGFIIGNFVKSLNLLQGLQVVIL